MCGCRLTASTKRASEEEKKPKPRALQPIVLTASPEEAKLMSGLHDVFKKRGNRHVEASELLGECSSVSLSTHTCFPTLRPATALAQRGEADDWRCLP